MESKEMEKKERRKADLKRVGYFLLFYIGLVILFYDIAKEQILYTEYSQKASIRTKEIGEIVDGDVIEQTVYYDGDFLSSLTLQVATYARKNTGKLRIEVQTDVGEGFQTIVACEYEMEQIADNSDLTLKIGKKLDSFPFHLRITTSGAEYGNAITLYAAEETQPEKRVYRNGEKGETALCIGVKGGRQSTFGKWYWELAVIFAFFLVGVLFWLLGDKGTGYRLRTHIERYEFLVNQLIRRDFKTKYKRSVLGFCWSFLNPLLTMLVQYVVFSTIFRSDIDNFPVYLLSAGIIFNFFTESVGGGLCAIVGNASLITKVFVPKYIYPFSKVLSTAINLVISMIPLLFTVWLTGEEFTKAFFLIPFLFLSLIAFCVGMSLILSTSMVFFRDTQFLWGIISLVWMYATPIFYPESIIPTRFAFILKWNPMYHYLKFFRTILMQGISPQMSEYGYCIGFSILFCVVGAWIFKKAQNHFVLYL